MFVNKTFFRNCALRVIILNIFINISLACSVPCIVVSILG